MNLKAVALFSKSEDLQNVNIGRNNTENKRNTNEAVSEIVGDELKINLNDFLDFLNVSCHVNDMIKNDVLPMTSTSEKMCSKSTTNVEFESLSKNRLANELQGQNSRSIRLGSKTDSNDRMRWRRRTLSVGTPTINREEAAGVSGMSRGLHPKLNEKLDFVINEGVMDPILPFICPVPMPLSLTGQAGFRIKQNVRLRCTEKLASGEGNVDGGNAPNSARDSARRGGGASRRKSLAGFRSPRTKIGGNKKTETDVVIHVCDEPKNARRDFYCPQSLLISKMGYFADIVNAQNLDDMDISVHCDIHVFDWLIRWVKHSARETGVVSAMDDAAAPLLDGNNVIPVLVSAGFLQMEPLIVECLAFCHAHLKHLVRTSCNLSCLNDIMLTRLAAMFTNDELEYVKDKTESVTSPLWMKLIQSLCEPVPETLRGHYFTLAGLYRCSKCGKYLTTTMEKAVTCLPSNVRMNRWGQLVSHHVRDMAWNISAFIGHLFRELKSWRLVYWKLWGLCHYFYCSECESYFPAFQMNWCTYHAEAAIFLGPPTEGRNTGPTGRYPCCGKQTFRYETVPLPSGCLFREHSVLLETDRERAIFSKCQLVAEGNALYENPPYSLRDIFQRDVAMRWDGSLFLPRRPRLGLLPALNAESSALINTPKCRGNEKQQMRSQASFSESSCDSSDTEAEQLTRSKHSSQHDEHSVSSDDGGESDYHRYTRKRSFCRKKAGAARRRQACDSVGGRCWSEGLSARSNQDHQRDFEERMMKKVIAIANHKTASDHSLSVQPLTVGGAYVRLEAEWKEQLKRGSGHNTSSNNNGGGGSINITSSITNISNAKQRNKSKIVEKELS